MGPGHRGFAGTEGLTVEAAGKLLKRAEGRAKVALVMQRKKVSAANARALLVENRGSLRAIVGTLPPGMGSSVLARGDSPGPRRGPHPGQRQPAPRRKQPKRRDNRPTKPPNLQKRLASSQAKRQLRRKLAPGGEQHGHSEHQFRSKTSKKPTA